MLWPYIAAFVVCKYVLVCLNDVLDHLETLLRDKGVETANKMDVCSKTVQLVIHTNRMLGCILAGIYPSHLTYTCIGFFFSSGMQKRKEKLF